MAPRKYYRFWGMTADGLWAITEAASQFQNRRNPRYWLALPATLALIHREDETVQNEETLTKNISASGVSVTTALNAKVGDRVRFACRSLDFFAIAIVRNRRSDDGGRANLHLEFDGHRFP